MGGAILQHRYHTKTYWRNIPHVALSHTVPRAELGHRSIVVQVLGVCGRFGTPLGWRTRIEINTEWFALLVLKRERERERRVTDEDKKERLVNNLTSKHIASNVAKCA